MTMLDASGKNSSPQQSHFWQFMDNLPGARIMKNMKIGTRLLLGFGVMVVITLVGAAFSYYGSSAATDNINRTGEVRVPTALASSRAQADLLRMLGDVRGYLALGQPEFRESYNQAKQSFENDLNELGSLAPKLNPANRSRLEELKNVYAKWGDLPEQLFELRDDQLVREPAYKMLVTDGILLGGRVLIALNQMIEAQGRREPTSENIVLLAEMARYQGTFASMLSGLRGYVTTRNRTFQGEYEANLALNQFAWERLLEKPEQFTAEQQTALDDIAQNRQAFLKLPDQMFEILEGERWREDLYLFSAQAVPLTEKMQNLLAQMTVDEQDLLQTDLNRGRLGLVRANRQTLTGGIVALILGVTLAFIFRENIAGPVLRLTGVAEQIREGHLETRAQVEAGDEIGALAETFNSMTGQLQQTLQQVRKEKRRADDLLEVVIPIGVELTAEKNFNRLLENILMEAKKFCHANAGILYLRRANENALRLAIIRNDSLHITLGGTTNKEVTYPPIPLQDEVGRPNYGQVASYVALNGDSMNIASTQKTDQFDFSDFRDEHGQPTYLSATSILTIPLKNPQNQVLGVLQLLDAQDPEIEQIIPFDQNLQQMMESFSSLAAAALEAYIREQGLKQEIQQLRIEIDEAKRQQQVSEIIESDFFTDLQARASKIRKRSHLPKTDSPEEQGASGTPAPSE